MPAESSTTIRERLLFVYLHHLASVSYAPPRRGASTALADKVAIILEGLLKHCDKFGGTIAGEADGRLWARTDDLLTTFEVPANVAAPNTYLGAELEILQGDLGAFYPDPQRLYFRQNAKLTAHDDYAAWVGKTFPATRLVNNRLTTVAQQSAGIAIADVPFLGVPLASQLDGKTWFVTRDEKTIIAAVRGHVLRKHAVSVDDVDRWVFGTAVSRQVRTPGATLYHQGPRRLEVFWPTDGTTLRDDELHTVRAVVQGADLGTYRMWCGFSPNVGRERVDADKELVDNYDAGWKEATGAMNLRREAYRGRGPYQLMFVARDRDWPKGGWALAKEVMVYIDAAQWRRE